MYRYIVPCTDTMLRYGNIVHRPKLSVWAGLERLTIPLGYRRAQGCRGWPQVRRMGRRAKSSPSLLIPPPAAGGRGTGSYLAAVQSRVTGRRPQDAVPWVAGRGCGWHGSCGLKPPVWLDIPSPQQLGSPTSQSLPRGWHLFWGRAAGYVAAGAGWGLGATGRPQGAADSIASVALPPALVRGLRRRLSYAAA